MNKSGYNFQKRQKEPAGKKKKGEKRLDKLAHKLVPDNNAEKKQSLQQKSDNHRDLKSFNGAIRWEQPTSKRKGLKNGNACFREGQKVQLLISGRTNIGFLAAINGTHQGILYKNQVFQPLRIGQEIDGFIKKLRDDEKIDLCLQKPGYKAIDSVSGKIMEQLRSHDGSIPITDKSSPKEVSDFFGISKKTFKKSHRKIIQKAAYRS